jgi:Entner-Doudoroff aldolase
MSETTIKQIERGRVIAILRGDFGGQETRLVETLSAGGITAVEVTLNSPNALPSIGRLLAEFGQQLAIGAGTVLHPDEVARVAELGAQFIVSPNCNAAVIAATKRAGLASFPGCFTPSEIVAALEAGADACKLFPAQTLGVGFVKALRGPLPQARLIPTGGVTPAVAREYFAVGAWAVGVGSELLGRGLAATPDWDALRERASEFVRAFVA